MKQETAVTEFKEQRQAKEPTVSIGLPVFNGERYLAQALDSILAQSFHDFELIISDNGSTDDTEHICRRYATADPRIRYYRQEKTRGVTWNFRQVALLSSGQYFLWMAADDMLAPEYVERCLQALRQNHDAVLCYSQALLCDEDGSLIRQEHQVVAANSPLPCERFRELIRMDHNCGAMFGLIRADILKKTPIHGDFPDSDRCLLAELALYGKFCQLPEPLFSHREHRERVTRMYPTRQERMWKLSPDGRSRIVFPHFRQFWEYVRCIHRVRLSWKNRLRCYWQMAVWLNQNRARLVRDLKFVLRQSVVARWKTDPTIRPATHP